MTSISRLLDRVRWDPSEDPADYVIAYADRFDDRLREVRLNAVRREGGALLLVDEQGHEIRLPLHRVRRVLRRGEVFWERARPADPGQR